MVKKAQCTYVWKYNNVTVKPLFVQLKLNLKLEK